MKNSITLKTSTIFKIVGFIVLFLLGNRISYLVNSGTQDILQNILDALNNLIPSFLSDGISVSSNKMDVLIGVLFAMIPLIYILSYRNGRTTRTNEEYGSAKFESLNSLEQIKEKGNETLLSKNCSLSFNTRKTHLNNNVCVIGCSGSGKGQGFMKPNILECSGNYIITDPKGDILNDVENELLENGYNIKVVNLVNFDKDLGYNPFLYFTDTKDVQLFISSFMKNTSDKDRKGGDEFWDNAEKLLYSACIYLIMAYADEDDYNWEMFLDLLDMIEAREGEVSDLDLLFEDVEKEINESLKYAATKEEKRAIKKSYEYCALSSYKRYKKGGEGKTTQSVLLTIGARMDITSTPEVQEFLSASDDNEVNLMDLINPKKLENGEYQKTALFIITSDRDKTFTFLSAIMYQQLLKLLYEKADNSLSSTVPIPTRFLFDEYVNSGGIVDAELYAATCRSRDISLVFLLQSLSQLKAIHKDTWESVIDNCDTILFLGGRGETTNTYLSKMIGKQTIYYSAVSESKGQSSSWSKGEHIAGRDLLAADEIGRLKYDECLVLIRGFNVYRDKKNNVKYHPKYIGGDA